MDSLQTTTRNGRSVATTQTDPLAALPSWLRYLVGAFPAAKVASTTYPVYEDQFSDTDPALMLQAIRQAIKGHRFTNFPTIAELRRMVDALEYEAAVSNRPTVNLQARRQELLEAAYQGEIDPAAWLDLWQLLIACKRLDGAAWLTEKYSWLTGEQLPDYRRRQGGR